jgi:hypothetical protein
MKYETPELIVLAPAINAIQAMGLKPNAADAADNGVNNEQIAVYADWE